MLTTLAANQLVLDLPTDDADRLEDFLRSPSNEAALDAVLHWPAWPAPALIVWGPAGSGRTHLARIWAQTSNIGKMLDPIADKLLISSILLLLAADGTIAGWPLWAAIIILCREILVSGLREYLAELKVSVPVTRIAKWKTTVQMIAIGFLLAGPAGDKILPYTTQTGIVLLWVAAIITLYTGYDYFRAGLKHVIE